MIYCGNKKCFSKLVSDLTSKVIPYGFHMSQKQHHGQGEGGHDFQNRVVGTHLNDVEPPLAQQKSQAQENDGE